MAIRAKDQIGTTINGFYIEDVKRENNRTLAYAVCPYCKNKKWMRMDGVTSKKIVSCGCYNAENNYKKPVDIKNAVFGYLKALEPTEERDKSNGSIIWRCECKCGNTVFISAAELLGKRVRSCGCLAIEVHSRSGGIAGKNIAENFCINGTNIKNLTAKIPKNNTSGVKGVHWDKSRQKWCAQIMFKGKNYNLGRYSKKEDAITVRKMAEEKIFGDFFKWFAEEFPERWENINKNKL